VSQELWWYTVRATGLVAWLLVTLAVVWGLLLSLRQIPASRRSGLPRPAWMLDLHRFLGGLALVFTGVHVLAIMADSYVQFGLVEVLVPFTSTWHPAAVAWGIVGFYLLVAVEVTSLLRRRLSKRLWRATHFLSFPLFALTTVHALAAGTDRATLPLRLGIIAAAVAVTVLTFIRIQQIERPSAGTGLRPPVPASR